MKENYWMTDEEYNLVTSKSVVPCTDLVVLRRKKNVLEVLLIKRKIEPGIGGWCIIGGRQFKGETLQQAIDRQASELGIEVKVISPFSSNVPTYINDNPNQDPTKHPDSITYPVKIISGKVKDRGKEYCEYRWVPVDPTEKIPKLNYGHRTQLLETIKQLKKFNSLNEI